MLFPSKSDGAKYKYLKGKWAWKGHPSSKTSGILYVVAKTKYSTHKKFFQTSHKKKEPHEITMLEGKNDMKRKNQV